jgi:DNA mismatch repair protein PMS2
MDELLAARREPTPAEDSAPDSEVESDASPEKSDADQDHTSDAGQVDSEQGDAEQSNTVEQLSDAGSDGEYMNEAEKKKREEEKITKMIAAAERLASRPTEDNLRRATSVLKARSRKGATLRLVKKVDTSVSEIHELIQNLATRLQEYDDSDEASRPEGDDEGQDEERLALAVSKSDFGRMKVAGQFNLGFILAMRPGRRDGTQDCDELFIIDQHASDEKFNFERLQAETVVQNQRLVHPQRLSLTAVEEELVLHHPEALAKNGFGVEVDESGAQPVGRRCALTSLPMSREVVFDATDLEELVALLAEQQGAGSSEVPRPSKVRRMFAMRACRSSIMVGRTLTARTMQTVVEHMGEIDKPWNCPHGRPTMRHLFGMGGWRGWREGEGLVGLGEERRPVDWRGYVGGAEDAASELDEH